MLFCIGSFCKKQDLQNNEQYKTCTFTKRALKWIYKNKGCGNASKNYKGFFVLEQGANG